MRYFEVIPRYNSHPVREWFDSKVSSELILLTVHIFLVHLGKSLPLLVLEDSQ